MTPENRRLAEEKLGYTFKNPVLLEQAFTRSSYVNEKLQAHKKPDTQSNEVLEFFGDSVLSCTLAYLLLERYATLGDEGLKTALGEADFSIIKSNMSDKKALAAAIRRLGVNHLLRLSRGDINQQVLRQDSPNEDLFESLVAAVALDCGMDFPTILGVVKRLDDVDRLLRHRGEGGATKNPKSVVKEYCEKQRIPYDYRHYGESGPEHDKVFMCRLTVEGYPPVEGEGRSRAKAEMAAAEKLLPHLTEK